MFEVTSRRGKVTSSEGAHKVATGGRVSAPSEAMALGLCWDHTAGLGTLACTGPTTTAELSGVFLGWFVLFAGSPVDPGA